ncbi:MAG: hypothetical protein OHK0026_10800 [Rhodocyclaceae bacterium]
MASLVLSAVGTAIGGPLGGTIGGLIGSALDRTLFAPTVSAEGPRLADLAVQASSYGQPIPRLWGTGRIAGNLIWSTGLIETKTTTKQGGKGGGAKTTTTTYSYHVDCAIALCRGPIAGVRRIWADGKLFRDADGVQRHAEALRVYPGSEDQMPDPAMQAALGAAGCPAHRGLAYVVFERLELADFGNRIPNFTFEVEAQASATVASVIEELCSLAGVPFLDAARTGRIDLAGYAVARPASIRQVLEPLRSAFFFDAAEIEGALAFFPADGTPVARVPAGELGAHPFGSEPPPLELRRTAEAELPRQITVQHLDPARDYQVNAQRARRSTSPSTADLSVDLPLVLEASEAKAIAERMVWLQWLGRDTVTCQLPIAYLHVEPGDKLVVLDGEGRARTLRVTRRELRLPGSLLVEAVTDGAAALSRIASAAPAPVPPQQVLLPGLTTAHLLDLPLLREEDDGPHLLIAAAGASAGWRGAVLERSADGGMTWERLADLTEAAVLGTTLDALPPASSHVWDRASSLTVSLRDPADTLESVSEAAVLGGANACLVGEEVLQFREATLIAPGTWRLSMLLRGRRGTAPAAHGPGARFALLSGGAGIARLAMPLAERGLARQWRAVSLGTRAEDAPVISLAWQARALVPLAPVHARGERNAAGDLAIGWIRRTRLPAPWTDHVDAPLGETGEAYQIDIMAGSSVKRTIATSAPQALYPAAEQIADFGSPQSAVTCRIHQLSERVGRGQALEVTL